MDDDQSHSGHPTSPDGGGVLSAPAELTKGLSLELDDGGLLENMEQGVGNGDLSLDVAEGPIRIRKKLLRSTVKLGTHAPAPPPPPAPRSVIRAESLIASSRALAGNLSVDLGPARESMGGFEEGSDFDFFSESFDDDDEKDDEEDEEEDEEEEEGEGQSDPGLNPDSNP